MAGATLAKRTSRSVNWHVTNGLFHSTKSASCQADTAARAVIVFPPVRGPPGVGQAADIRASSTPPATTLATWPAALAPIACISG